MKWKLLVLTAMAGLVGCSADLDAVAGESDDALTGDATMKFTSNFQTTVSGSPAAGKGILVDYALDRLPQCRGALNGGGPAWNITGYYSENAGPAHAFEVTELSSDGTDRVAKQARIPLTQGGDISIWFQVSNRWGCSEYDSRFGQNYHLTVQGALPTSTASILFKKDGAVEKSGDLRVGGKVKVRYEQDRLPQCRRTNMGYPAWGISGFASINGAQPRTFETGRPEGSDRAPIDAYLDLTAPGELALWFQVVDMGGCNAFDSNQGQNYKFPIAP